MRALIAHGSLVVGVGTLEYLVQHLLKRTIQSYNKTWNERYLFLLSNRLLGGSHSLMVGLWALREATRDHWRRDDLIFTKSSIGDKIVAVELGFILQGERHFVMSDSSKAPELLSELGRYTTLS